MVEPDLPLQSAPKSLTHSLLTPAYVRNLTVVAGTNFKKNVHTEIR